MIVTSVEDGWEIVFQPAHGLLAGRLADHLAEEHRCEYWFETKAAITSHDDHKVAFRDDGRSYVTEVGAPKDFTLVSMSAEKRFTEVRDRIENAYRKHRWIGLLESSHADFLYAEQKVSKSLEDLLETETKRRKLVLRGLKRKKCDLEKSYEIMRWCDRCSLVLCQDKVPAMGRHLEILTRSNGTRYDISRRKDDSVTVEPWPFALDEFSISVEVHTLRQLSFADDAELKRALNECEPKFRTWQFKKDA